MKIEVIRAWPRAFERRELELAEGGTVGDALRESGMTLDGVQGVAIYGERVPHDRVLRDGERVELLGGLIADPKEARRKRAGQPQRPADPRRS